MLAKVYKSKYYPNTTLLEATQKWSSSYAWRSILQGIKLLKQGFKWIIWNGDQIHVWKNQWLPISPSAPATGIGTYVNPELRVSDLFTQGITNWDEAKLIALYLSMDIPLIKMLHPFVTRVHDTITWLHTKYGEYTVRYGYNLLRYQKGQTSSTPTHLYQALWQHNLPPKVKHFWWMVFHEALHVATKLKQRKILKDNPCQMCGEVEESINHMLLSCRIIREIWELAPVNSPLAKLLLSHDLHDNYVSFTYSNKASTEQLMLFHLLGWRIWKQRNEIVFKNK